MYRLSILVPFFEGMCLYSGRVTLVVVISLPVYAAISGVLNPNDYRELAEDNYVASHDYLDKEKTVIEQTRELATQQSHARELEPGVEEQQHDIDGTVATLGALFPFMHRMHSQNRSRTNLQEANQPLEVWSD